MRTKIIELLHPEWATWPYSEKKDYLLEVYKSLGSAKETKTVETLGLMIDLYKKPVFVGALHFGGFKVSTLLEGDKFCTLTIFIQGPEDIKRVEEIINKVNTYFRNK